jgi:hypothetical protein
MAEILSEANKIKMSRGGRKSKISIKNMLLMALSYLRKYDTYADIGLAHGVCESRAYRIIRWVENKLIKDSSFSLPGRKELLRKNNNIETLLIDATEIPIEQPQKNRRSTILGKRKDHSILTGNVMISDYLRNLKYQFIRILR